MLDIYTHVCYYTITGNKRVPKEKEIKKMFDVEKAHNEWWNSLSEEEQKRMQEEVDLYCDQMDNYKAACKAKRQQEVLGILSGCALALGLLASQLANLL